MSLLLRFQGGFGVDLYSQDTIITVPQDVAEKSGLFVADYVVNVKVPLGSLNGFLHVTCDETGNFLRDLYSDETYDGAKSPRGNWYLDVPAVLAKWAEAGFPLNWELGLASDLTDVELAEQARLVELYEAMRLDALAEEAHWSNSDAPTNYELDEADRLDELYDARLAALAEEDELVEMQLADWEARLDELYDARLDELYDAHLADLFEEDQLVENQLAEAKWAYPTNSELYEDDHLADMHEEVRLDALDEEASRIAEWAEEARLAACSSEGAPYSWNYDMQ